LVVTWHEGVGDISVGSIQRANAGQAQLVDQSILEGAVHAFATTSSLRGERKDVLHSQTCERSSDLSELFAVRTFAGARCVCGPTGSIGVERLRDPVRGNHRVQRGQDRLGAFTPAEMSMK